MLLGTGVVSPVGSDGDRHGLHSSWLLGATLSLDEWRLHPFPWRLHTCSLAEAISQMGHYENALPVFITTISFLVANVISNTTSS